eukprot:12126844-Ditylum_brightwellii.AAC.2
MEYRQLIKSEEKAKWLKSSANEFGCLAQGIGNKIPNGKNTTFFIPKGKIPEGRKPTYPKCVVNIRPQKEEQHWMQLTVGGNLINYPGNVST